MSHCVIHIGMHKTGSTSIQRSLAGLQDSQFLYAPLGPEPNHSIPLCVLFSSDPARFTRNKPSIRHLGDDPAYRALVRDRLDAAVGLCGDRTLLVSGEDICALTPSDLAELYRYFRAHFDRIEVVAYVRPPAAFMASAFQERVKGHLDSFDLDAMLGSYQKTFRKFDELFGEPNVHLWKFDPARFPDRCVVRDFCSRLGIHLPVDRIKRANDSVARPALDLLYCYRKFGKRFGAADMPAGEAQRVGMALSVLGAGKLRFASDLVRPILHRHRADIQWMEARLGASLAEDLSHCQPGDVGGEEDLLNPDPGVIDGLLALLGDAAPPGNRGRTPEEIAALVHVLRGQVAEASRQRQAVSSGQPARNAGRIALIRSNAVLGWAVGRDGTTPAKLALFVNGVEVARTVADQPRPALVERGIHPTGQCGFIFRLQADRQLKVGDLVVVRSLDGNCVIDQSPSIVQAPDPTQEHHEGVPKAGFGLASAGGHPSALG